jgi:DNA-3-methyladenine glycosylase II
LNRKKLHLVSYLKSDITNKCRDHLHHNIPEAQLYLSKDSLTMSKIANNQKKISQARKARTHLSRVDPKLKIYIEKIGTMNVELDPEETVFESLGTSILYQQLHGKAAAKILGRLKILFGSSESFPSPSQIVEASVEHLMTAGLSQAKSNALKDLAEKSIEGLIPDRVGTHKMTNEDIIEAFCKVRGIGRWTAEMFLMFTLGRLDVLPVHDFGVRLGYMKVYHKRRMPTPKELDRYGERWRPFRTAAAWYMWRALELPEFQKKKS